MGKEHQVQKLMKQCKLLRAKCQTAFLDIQKFWQFMHQTILEKNNFISCSTKSTSNNLFDKQFFSTFQSLSQTEQTKYYYGMLKIFKAYLSGSIGLANQLSQQQQINLTNSQFSKFDIIFLQKGLLRSSSKNYILHIDKKQAILQFKSLQDSFRNSQILLQNYLTRESRKNKYIKEGNKKEIVFKSIYHNVNPQQIRIKVRQQQFQKLHSELQILCIQQHGVQLQQKIKQLSQGTGKKGFAQIIFTLSTHHTNLESVQSQFSDNRKNKYLFQKHTNDKLSGQSLNQVGLKDIQKQGHFVWGKQWQKGSKGQLKNIDYDYIGVQRNAAKKVIKSLGSNLLSKGNLNVEIPIQMFSHQSNLLQLCRACKYFPYFFQSNKDSIHNIQPIIIDGFKKVFYSIVGFLLVRNRMDKPIQPFLGETYQGFINNYPIYAEQIGKNQSYIYYETQNIKLYGSLELQTINSGINSILAGSKGYLNLQFLKLKKSPKIMFTIPMMELSGLIFGDRLVQIKDSSVIYEEQNKIFCCLDWGKLKIKEKHFSQLSQKYDFVYGKICRLNNNSDFSIRKCIDDKNYLNQFLKENPISTNLGILAGNWTSELFYVKANEKSQLFKIDEEKPPLLYHYDHSLQSDGRYRHDIQLAQEDELTQAQKIRKKQKQKFDQEQKLRKKTK